MASTKDKMLRIPTRSVYTVTADSVELTHAEYSDVSVDALAGLLAGHFNLSLDDMEPENEVSTVNQTEEG